MGDVNLYDTQQNLEDDGLGFLDKKNQDSSNSGESIGQESDSNEVQKIIRQLELEKRR